MPMNLRSIIQTEMKRQGRSAYWLAENSGEGHHKNAVYSFLRGDTEGSSMLMVAMLEALDMRIVPGEGPVKSATKPRKKK